MQEPTSSPRYSCFLEPIHTRKPKRPPGVLSRREVERLLQHVEGVPGLVARMLYGTGMRIVEALRLRVKDLDLEMHQVMVRDGRGGKGRIALLPEVLVYPLGLHLALRRSQYRRDRDDGCGPAWLPAGLLRRHPGAGREWGWQYVFVAPALAADSRTGRPHRSRLEEAAVRHCIRQAAQRAGIRRRVSPQVLRHSFATHLLDCGHDIRTVQELLGHPDVRMTLRYVRILGSDAMATQEPR